MGIRTFLYFCTSRYNRRNPIFLFLKKVMAKKPAKICQNPSLEGGRNPPTKSKIFENPIFFSEIAQFYFFIVIYVQNQSKNNIYTFLRLFFRNFKFFWSAFFWAFRISTTYFFIFRPRDLRDGSFGQKWIILKIWNDKLAILTIIF